MKMKMTNGTQQQQPNKYKNKTKRIIKRQKGNKILQIKGKQH